ncbi:site-specific integrase, partial [Candidatus Parcubacteria bacterium]
NVYHRIRARSPESTKGAVSLALHRMLLICRKAGILEGRVTISQRIRREEIPIHSSDAFALLDDFIAIREWLLSRIQSVPRSRKDLPQLVIASLIAINGVTLPSAPRKIGACKTSMLRNDAGGTILEVPVAHLSSKNPPKIQYFLLPELENLLQHLKGREPWLFPPSWTPEQTGGKRKIPTRMNRWLSDLWDKVMPRERPKPNQWNITTFIQCSRLYFALHCPPVIAGFLSGRSTFAAYSGSTASVPHASSSAPAPIQVDQAPETDERPESLALAQQIIEGIGSMLRQFDRKRQNPGAKKEAAARLAAILVAYEDTINDIPALHRLSAWMLDELLGDGGKRKMGTFQSMWQFIPSILVNELGAADPASLDDGEWLRLAEYVIQENTYASATRNKIKNHLKSFHTWLVGKHPETGRINWRIGALRIAGERPETLFPTLGEFDRLFQAAAKLPPQNALPLQAALTLAFFGGLRAEEITLISKMDMDETTIQVRVWWSKTRKGRRRVPLGLLAPKVYIQPVLALRDQCRLTDSFLLTPESKDPMNPGTLSKQVLRLVTQNLPENRRMTLHAFRHGFASWLMIRYFALIEPGLLTTT